MPTISILGSHAATKMLMIVFAIMGSACSVPAQKRTSIPEPVQSVPTSMTRPASEPTSAPGLPIFIAPPTEAAVSKPPAPVTRETDKLLPHIALLLPLASKTFGKVADALKLGFVAAAEVEGENAAPYRIYSAGDEGGALAAQYRIAVAEGAFAIVGGVTRDGANTIARESRFLPTLALNAPVISSDNDLPDRLVYISLNLDLEAKLVARMALNEGLRNIVMVVANNPLAKRMQESFEQEWIRLGGAVPGRISFGNEPNDAKRVAAAMERINATNERVGARTDAVFLAADPAAARFIRPYLPTGMAVFTTSHTVDPRAEAIANLDLENVRFLEMPWFVEHDHPAVMSYAKPEPALQTEYERLYALGIDAWRLGQLLVNSENARRLPPLDGVTGRITQEGHQLVRALSSVEVRDGKSQLYRPAQ